jgi:predicted DNA-binding transcriptional regulator AlpA
MTLLTRAALLDKYGFRLTMEQLGHVLGLSPGHISNLVSNGQFPIRTYKEGGRRFASYEAVAEYLEKMDEEAKR